MQTWVTLAAKHATLASGIGLGAVPAMGWESLDGVAVGFFLAGAGFAVANSTRQARSCPLPPAAAAGPARAESSRQQAGALTRIRRRVDGLLTGMLSDDAEQLSAQTPVLVPVPSAAEPRPAEPGRARSPWPGDYVGANAGPARARSGSSAAATAPARSERPERVGNWPYLTLVRDIEEQPAAPRRAAAAGLTDDDPAFWGPMPPQQATGGSRRSKHRADGNGTARAARDSTAGDSTASQGTVSQGTAREGTASASRAIGGTTSGSTTSGSTTSGSTTGGSTGDGGVGRDQDTGTNARPDDRKRPGPRHAAPPAGFGATLGRRLASPRLTSRSAAHAG